MADSEGAIPEDWIEDAQRSAADGAIAGARATGSEERRHRVSEAAAAAAPWAVPGGSDAWQAASSSAPAASPSKAKVGAEDQVASPALGSSDRQEVDGWEKTASAWEASSERRAQPEDHVDSWEKGAGASPVLRARDRDFEEAAPAQAAERSSDGKRAWAAAVASGGTAKAEATADYAAPWKRRSRGSRVDSAAAASPEAQPALTVQTPEGPGTAQAPPLAAQPASVAATAGAASPGAASAAVEARLAELKWAGPAGFQRLLAAVTWHPEAWDMLSMIVRWHPKGHDVLVSACSEKPGDYSALTKRTSDESPVDAAQTTEQSRAPETRQGAGTETWQTPAGYDEQLQQTLHAPDDMNAAPEECAICIDSDDDDTADAAKQSPDAEQAAPASSDRVDRINCWIHNDQLGLQPAWASISLGSADGLKCNWYEEPAILFTAHSRSSTATPEQQKHDNGVKKTEADLVNCLDMLLGIAPQDDKVPVPRESANGSEANPNEDSAASKDDIDRSLASNSCSSKPSASSESTPNAVGQPEVGSLAALKEALMGSVSSSGPTPASSDGVDSRRDEEGAAQILELLNAQVPEADLGLLANLYSVADSSRSPSAAVRAGASIRTPISHVKGVQITPDGHQIVLCFMPPLEFVSPETETQVAFEAQVHVLTLTLRPEDAAEAAEVLLRWLPHAEVEDYASARDLSMSASPPILRLGRIQVRPRDLAFLNDGDFLNDTIIDFTLRLALELVAPPELQESVHLASCYFFKQLTAHGAGSGEKGWENVKNWTRQLAGGIMSREFIVVPMNAGEVHWWLAVVCRPNGDSLRGPQRVVCLDSSPFPFTERANIRTLRGYMRREWNERGGGAQPPDQMKAVLAKTSKQKNYVDCGVFSIEYLLHLFKHPKKLANLGLKTQRPWFSQARVSHRRQRLRWMISRLAAAGKEQNEVDVHVLLKDEHLRRLVLDALLDDPPPKEKKQRRSPHLWRGVRKHHGAIAKRSQAKQRAKAQAKQRAKAKPQQKSAATAPVPSPPERSLSASTEASAPLDEQEQLQQMMEEEDQQQQQQQKVHCQQQEQQDQQDQQQHEQPQEMPQEPPLKKQKKLLPKAKPRIKGEAAAADASPPPARGPADASDPATGSCAPPASEQVGAVHRPPPAADGPATNSSKERVVDSAVDPPLPADASLRKNIEIMARQVASLGTAFETMVLKTNRDKPQFAFLYGGEGSHYYDQVLADARARAAS